MCLICPKPIADRVNGSTGDGGHRRCAAYRRAGKANQYLAPKVRCLAWGEKSTLWSLFLTHRGFTKQRSPCAKALTGDAGQST